MAELDRVAVGVAHVERGALPPRSEARPGSVDHLEAPRRGQLVEVDRVDHQAEVVDVVPAGLDLQQVDDGVVAHPHRREEDLPRTPLVDALRFEAELARVLRERALDVGDVEHEVVEGEDPEHPRMLRSGRTAMQHGRWVDGEMVAAIAA